MYFSNSDNNFFKSAEQQRLSGFVRRPDADMIFKTHRGKRRVLSET